MFSGSQVPSFLKEPPSAQIPIYLHTQTKVLTLKLHNLKWEPDKHKIFSNSHSQGRTYSSIFYCLKKNLPYAVFCETKSCCFQELLPEKPGTDSSEWSGNPSFVSWQTDWPPTLQSMRIYILLNYCNHKSNEQKDVFGQRFFPGKLLS